LSHNWRAYKRSGCNSSEGNLTETHFVLLFCEVLCTPESLLHNGGAISSIESPDTVKLSRFIEVLHISYNAGIICRLRELNYVYAIVAIAIRSIIMKIAVHQMCSGTDPEQNCADMVAAIYQSSRAGAAMYFAPEMSILLDRDRNRARSHIVSESESRQLLAISKTAKEAAIWVHLGSIPVLHESSGKYANRTLVIDADGQVRARYDKMHLFDVDLSSGESWRESAAYLGGDAPVAVDTPLGLMGLTICYDIRFPELYSALIRSVVDIITVPAAFTVPTGTAHWHTLLKARAIEAEAFVVAAAQSGQHQDGRMTYGHSLVLDPWGEVLLDMGDGAGLGFVELDLKRLAEVRAQIPVHQNRREISMPVRRY
jgi:deaminated glutathione amidase